MKQKKIYSILAIIAFCIMGITMLFIFSHQTKTSGTIHLLIVGENNQILFDQDVSFYEKDRLIDVLKRQVKIEEGTGATKGMVIGINDVRTDISKNYFKVIINCAFATHGVFEQTLNDQDEIRIIYSDISDWSTGC